MDGEGLVMLGFIHNGTVRTEFMQSVLAIVSGPRVSPLIGGICDASVGPLVAIARNTLTSKFLEGPLDWLWCVDTDVMFAPDTLGRLLASADPVERPIVSALYYINMGTPDGDRIVPAMFRAGTVDDQFTFAPIEEWPGGKLARVDGVGAGCMLIHRDALLRMKKDQDDQELWWREIVFRGKYIGEDLSFCVRAATSEIPIHVHTGIGVGHVKAITLGGIT